MILYFSGTGNSAYVAKQIGKKTNQEVVNLFEKIKNHDYSKMVSNDAWIIVSPTYAWRIPRILEEWLEHTELLGSKDIYFVLTCGGNIGNADVYNKKLCALKNMNDLGSYEIVMPENYVAMFATPTKEEALSIIKKADIEINKMISYICEKKAFPSSKITLSDKLSSGIINDIFYPMFVRAKKFRVKEKCISCGKCASVCPLNNIQIIDGKPVWKDYCTHCMGCISYCPIEAIEYGKHSVNKPKYICPK